MKFFSNFTNKPLRFSRQFDEVSVTIPGQAPHLKYLIGALRRGESINVRQAMTYDQLPKFDTPIIEDFKHLTSSDVDTLLANFDVPEESPM